MVFYLLSALLSLCFAPMSNKYGCYLNLVVYPINMQKWLNQISYQNQTLNCQVYTTIGKEEKSKKVYDDNFVPGKLNGFVRKISISPPYLHGQSAAFCFFGGR